MRGQFLKTLFSLVFVLLFVGSLLTSVVWYVFDHSSNVEPRRPSPQKKSAPEKITPGKNAPEKSATTPRQLCKGCREVIDKVNERYSQTWKKQEENYQKFRSQLSNKCHGSEMAIITQANTAVGKKIQYDGEKKRTLQVTPEIFSTFIKEHPFPNKTWDTCAVVGNSGILSNSGCGPMIDAAQFVIRCNLPPLKNGYEKHVGVKTDLVTANPSIFLEKYGALNGRRRPFVENMKTYGNSLLLIPAFSYGHNTAVSLRVAYTIEDFESPIRPIFFNPEYLQSLAVFWRSQGVRAVRLSTGIIMVSLALEFCANVHLYGFWPFSNHPHGLHALTNHYYDDRQTKVKFHAMPVEFDLLLRLHSEGVLKLHLGECKPGEK
ncbi:alpha-2,8-sialyltransferase 8F isoform X1 [Acanthopagrus latus]|uniref:alpha-2,8-sialyltransferase 8F isoform X1 n=1 Tax=Acanthopagrus latus TaxID=8177 RepID=UPI00187C4CFE|nr:alpha-2,8-sialyltransferase 8F isoform X1 [Acanthopagrus latus]